MENNKHKIIIVAILIADKVDLKIKSIARNRKIFYNEKKLIHQEGIIFIYVYVPYNRAPKSRKPN